MTEEVLAQSRAILRWDGQKRGRTMLTAKGGTLLLTTDRLMFLSTGRNALIGGMTPASIAEGLTRKGSLEIPLQRITTCEVHSKWGLLTVGFRDARGAESWTTFGEQVAGMPDANAWRAAIDQARRAVPAPQEVPGAMPVPDPSQSGDAPAPPPRPTMSREQELEASAPPPPPMMSREQELEAPAPPPPPMMSREQALEELRALRLQSPDRWRDSDLAALVASLRRMRDLAFALDLGAPTYEALARAVEQPDDAAAMFGAGFQLIDVGIPDLAVAPLTRSLELLPAHGPTLDELALALEAANRPDEAARLLLAHPAVLEERESTRALCSQFAAMAGDVTTARQLAEKLPADGDYGFFRDRALARAARADAVAGVTPLHRGDLRGWEAVLNGTVVLHRSEFGSDEAEPEVDRRTVREVDDGMNGRYGALWDNPDRFRAILAVVTAALEEAGRTPSRVVAGPDRDSQILGWALTTRLGLAAPTPLAEATPGSLTLVAGYDWGQLDEPIGRRFLRDPDAVVFAYHLDWTTASGMAPDLAGMEAQALFPAWGQRMRVLGTPGEGPTEVVDDPGDDRDPQVIGTELAAVPSAAPAADAEPVLALVRALRSVPDSVGLFGGRRDRFYPDGPVRSARFM